MPLYDFRCDTCGEFDAWQTLAELDQAMKCPTCQASACRLFSAPNINLSSGKLKNLDRQASSDPRRIQRDRTPIPPRNQTSKSASTRPWMINHSSERL